MRIDAARAPGRWGEAQSVPGNPDPATELRRCRPVPSTWWCPQPYNNRIRAGYSLDIGDARQRHPPRRRRRQLQLVRPLSLRWARGWARSATSTSCDLAGALLLPVERMRRYVTPADINGTGSVVQWNGVNRQRRSATSAATSGAASSTSSYFRPPGLPGQVAPHRRAEPGAVTFPWASGPRVSTYPSRRWSPRTSPPPTTRTTTTRSTASSRSGSPT